MYRFLYSTLASLLIVPICLCAEHQHTYNTVLDAKNITVLSTDVQARVNKINKKMGESFEKGETLIELDDVVYRANLLKAMAKLDKARCQKDAKKELFDDDIVSQYELKESEAEHSCAEADLVVQKQLLNSTKITAPYKGKVVNVDVHEHELVTPGKGLIEIVHDAALVAKIQVPSSLAYKMKIGQPINIQVKETGTGIIGYVDKIGAVVDHTNSSIKIEVAIDNKSGLLKAGMTGAASLR